MKIRIQKQKIKIKILQKTGNIIWVSTKNTILYGRLNYIIIFITFGTYKNSIQPRNSYIVIVLIWNNGVYLSG